MHGTTAMNEKYFEALGQTVWGNLNGTSQTFADMDHSYISNVYWHLRLREKLDKAFDLQLALQLNDYIRDKFDYILDYRPWTANEVASLERADFVHDDGVVVRLHNGMAIGRTDWRTLQEKIIDGGEHQWPY